MIEFEFEWLNDVWDTKGKGVCRCISAEHGDNELELGHDEILADGLIKKGIKEQTQLEVAIGDGMEFTIHGDMKNSKPKKSKYLNNATVNTLDLNHQIFNPLFPIFWKKKVIPKHMYMIIMYFYLLDLNSSLLYTYIFSHLENITIRYTLFQLKIYWIFS